MGMFDTSTTWGRTPIVLNVDRKLCSFSIGPRFDMGLTVHGDRITAGFLSVG